MRNDGLLSDHFPLKGIENWSAWLVTGNPEGVDDYIRTQTFTGHPCGSIEFFRRLEGQLGRQPLSRKRGRPRDGKE